MRCVYSPLVLFPVASICRNESENVPANLCACKCGLDRVTSVVGLIRSTAPLGLKFVLKLQVTIGFSCSTLALPIQEASVSRVSAAAQLCFLRGTSRRPLKYSMRLRSTRAQEQCAGDRFLALYTYLWV